MDQEIFAAQESDRPQPEPGSELGSEPEPKFGVWSNLTEAWVSRNQTQQEAQSALEKYRQNNLPRAAEAAEIKVYDPDRLVARCIQCDKTFSQGELDRLAPDCCPNCGNRGLPVNPEFDTTVKINWSELRILGIWAENWARQCDREEPASGYNCIRTIHSIAYRLQKQHPDYPPLTLSGEIRKIQEQGYRVETSFDARENLAPELVNPSGRQTGDLAKSGDGEEREGGEN